MRAWVMGVVNRWKRERYDLNMVVSIQWLEPNTLEIHPLKGADRSAVGVWELGQSIDLEVREDRVHLQIAAADFADKIDDLLRYSAIVTSHKLPKALTLLAEQGVILREGE